jgi:hypothetical protein
MTTKDQVENFLKDFKEKMKIWDVAFRNDRCKNTQALADLEITPLTRKNILCSLSVADFSEGPLEDTLYKNSNMWVFGKKVKDCEIYIIITMGFPNKSVICISFHVATQHLQYPFKDTSL